MELMDAVMRRRSVRKYKEKNVDSELLDELFEAARLSPSAHNRQPWRFMVLRGEKKDQIARIMEDWFSEQTGEIPRYAKTSKYTAGTIRQAPVLILVFRKQDEVWELGDTLSIGAAMEHMCLRAEELGLGTLWILDTRYTEEKICRYVGRSDLVLASAMAVGYPDECPGPRPRAERRELILE